MPMESLPDDLPDDVWHRILETGIGTERLDHTDLCSLAIVNRRFDQLTRNPVLWAALLSRDFRCSYQAPCKDLYREEHEMNRILEQMEEMLQDLTLRYAAWSDSISYGSSLQSNPSQIATSGSQMNITDHNFFVNGTDVLPLYHEPDPLPPRANQPNLRPAHRHYYESNSSKRFDKLSKRKVIPNSKSYVRMNRPPRRSNAEENLKEVIDCLSTCSSCIADKLLSVAMLL